MQRVFNAGLLLFHFHFGTGTNLDDGNTASQLGNTLLQLLLVVIGRAVFDLLADLLNASFDVRLCSCTADDGGVFLGHVDTLGCAQVIKGGVLERQADFFRDDCATGKDRDVLQHFLATVTKAGCLNSVDLHDATHVVHNQSCKRFAFDVLSDDLQRLASLGYSFQHRQQLADVGNLLVDKQDVRVFQLGRHVVLVVDEVRRQEATVELHTFNHVQLVFQASAFLNGNYAFLANFFHCIGDDLTDGIVTVGRDSAYLSDHLAVVTGLGHITDCLHGFRCGLVDAALQIHRVHAGSNCLNALVNDGLSQNGCGSGTVTGGVVGLGSHFFHHLGAHVLELVRQFDFLGYGNTIFGDGRRAEGLFQNHVTAFRAEGHFNRVCQYIDARDHALTCAITESNVFCCHVFYSCSLNRSC